MSGLVRVEHDGSLRYPGELCPVVADRPPAVALHDQLPSQLAGQGLLGFFGLPVRVSPRGVRDGAACESTWYHFGSLWNAGTGICAECGLGVWALPAGIRAIFLAVS